MPQQRKNVKRFKPVHTDSWLLLKKTVNRFKPVRTNLRTTKIPKRRKNVKRLKPVNNDSRFFLKKDVKRFKPVHTVSWLVLKKKHKPVQTGSNRFKDLSP